jgi:hypothetical protein
VREDAVSKRRLVWVACVLVIVAAMGDAAAILGGTADDMPPDSPENRVDPNTTSSPFAGVGSLTVFSTGSEQATAHFTAAAIDPWHVLTAAHVVAGKAPGDVRFNLNYGGDLTMQIRAQAIVVHPDYAGFVPSPASGVVHDDIAIVRLSSALPFGVPLYRIQPTLVPARTVLTLVGYGGGGDGRNGVITGATPTVKRVGRNSLDRAFPDNAGRGAMEIFLYDFDGPDASSNRMGGRTLGNHIEAAAAGGDSGSPALIPGPGGAWWIVGVNTFVSPQGPARERFGAVGGGVLLYSYVGWIESVLASGSAGAAPAAH